MGPGYMPMLLSFGLIGFAAIVAVRAFTIDGPPIEAVALAHESFSIPVAIVAFALLIENAGLALATVAVTALACTGFERGEMDGDHRARRRAGVFCVLIFVYVLKQPVPVFWGS